MVGLSQNFGHHVIRGVRRWVVCGACIIAINPHPVSCGAGDWSIDRVGGTGCRYSQPQDVARPPPNFRAVRRRARVATAASLLHPALGQNFLTATCPTHGQTLARPRARSPIWRMWRALRRQDRRLLGPPQEPASKANACGGRSRGSGVAVRQFKAMWSEAFLRCLVSRSRRLFGGSFQLSERSCSCVTTHPLPRCPLPGKEHGDAYRVIQATNFASAKQRNPFGTCMTVTSICAFRPSPGKRRLVREARQGRRN